MCTAAFMESMSPGKKKPVDDQATDTPPQASDVPLGTGLADVAKTSILSRRERIRQAVEEAGG